MFVTVTNVITAELGADNRPTGPKPTSAVDLQSKANQKLSDSLHGFSGNDLAELPKGEQTFGGVRFKVEEGYLRLSGTVETSAQPKKPGKLEGIAIGKAFARLHILHGTGYGAYGTDGDPLFVKDGTLIGEYHLHYEDGTTESIPIVYGQDVRDWWTWDKPAEVTRGKTAWTGKNAFSRQQNQSIHLYLTSWNNPHPEKKVSRLDYLCTGTSAASPFCIAISLEEK
jgi:hypothetical protein